MKVVEKTFSNKTIYSLIPKSRDIDLNEIIANIKKKKAQPFHYVYLNIPIYWVEECIKEIKNNDLYVRQMNVSGDIVSMEVC